MRISVVLPTHNRADLLREAIASVQNQTWPDWELIVVDDGSVPPAYQERDDGIDHPVKWLRNELAQGPSNARNRGIEVAGGDIVTFLDDDDLLTENALEVIAQQFQQNPDLECLFINIEPFGAAGNGMRQNQAQALNAVLARMEVSGHTQAASVHPCDVHGSTSAVRGRTPEAADVHGSTSATRGRVPEVACPAEVLPLGQNLFEGLLEGLPLAFQRAAIRRPALQRVGLYQPGSFGDIEWYFRLALRCRCSLLLTPLYRQRCDGQSFFTRSEAQEKLLDAAIRIRLQLAALPEVTEQPRLADKVRRALAKSRFDKAYFSHRAGNRFAWQEFLLSLRGNFGWRHVSLLAKVLFSMFRPTTPLKSR
jgi:hypothetical protein